MAQTTAPALIWIGLFLHVEIDRAVLAGGLGLVRIGRADDGRIEHVALRIGHRVRQVGRLDLAQVVVERIRHLGLDRLGAVAAGGAVLVDVARRDLDAWRCSRRACR